MAGLLVSGIVVVTVPKYIKPLINAVKGKEYKVSQKELAAEDFEPATK